MLLSIVLLLGVIASGNRETSHEKHPRTINNNNNARSTSVTTGRESSDLLRRLSSGGNNVAKAETLRFPPSSEVVEMVHLSFIMYTLKNKVFSCNDEEGIVKRVLPQDTTCILYSHDTDQGTQVMVVKSFSQKFIAVVYAGTDDWKTLLTDGDILLSSFGEESNQNQDDSEHDNFVRSNSTTSSNSTNDNEGSRSRGWADNVIPPDVKIHRGFNSAVFGKGGFDLVVDAVRSAMQTSTNGNGNNTEINSNNEYRLMTTGHSLGAADSVITAVGLHLSFPEKIITSINFGCPKVGNYAWSQWLRSLSPPLFVGGSDEEASGNYTMGGVNVYRFVNGRDMVPRLPEYPFHHAGHTVQIDHTDESCCEAYYHHDGDEDLGFSGVPLSWNRELVCALSCCDAHFIIYDRSFETDFCVLLVWHISMQFLLLFGFPVPSRNIEDLISKC